MNQWTEQRRSRLLMLVDIIQSIKGLNRTNKRREYLTIFCCPQTSEFLVLKLWLGLGLEHHPFRMGPSGLHWNYTTSFPAPLVCRWRWCDIFASIIAVSEWNLCAFIMKSLCLSMYILLVLLLWRTPTNTTSLWKCFLFQNLEISKCWPG